LPRDFFYLIDNPTRCGYNICGLAGGFSPPVWMLVFSIVRCTSEDVR